METSFQLVLSIEIGGTNARFGTFVVTGANTKRRVELTGLMTLPTSGASSCIELFQNYFKSRSERFAIVVLSAAGPVSQGRCTPPNIPWTIDLARDTALFGAPKNLLMNDLAAQAHAVPLLLPDAEALGFNFHPALEVLSGPDPLEDAERSGMLSIGTGFGRAVIVRNSRYGFTVLPSEAGHNCFPAIGPDEATLVQRVCYCSSKEFLTWEDVLSGKGFVGVVAAVLGRPVSSDELPALLRSEIRVGELFSRLVARAVRSFAFDILPTGGLFLSGGMLRANKTLLSSATFREEFGNTPTFPDIPRSTRVTLVDSDLLGLWGGVRFALSG